MATTCTAARCTPTPTRTCWTSTATSSESRTSFVPSAGYRRTPTCRPSTSSSRAACASGTSPPLTLTLPPPELTLSLPLPLPLTPTLTLTFTLTLTTHHSPLTTHHSTFTLTLTTLTLALTLTLTRYESIYEGSRSRLPGPKRGIDDKGRPRGFRAGPEEALVRQKEVNTFLSSFVSNNLEVSTVRT